MKEVRLEAMGRPLDVGKKKREIEILKIERGKTLIWKKDLLIPW